MSLLRHLAGKMLDRILPPEPPPVVAEPVVPVAAPGDAMLEPAIDPHRKCPDYAREDPDYTCSDDCPAMQAREDRTELPIATMATIEIPILVTELRIGGSDNLLEEAAKKRPWKDALLTLRANIDRILADPTLDARAELAKLVEHNHRITRPKKRDAKACRVPGCEAPHRAKEFCGAHYQQWSRGKLDLSTLPEVS